MGQDQSRLCALGSLKGPWPPILKQLGSTRDPGPRDVSNRETRGFWSKESRSFFLLLNFILTVKELGFRVAFSNKIYLC